MPSDVAIRKTVGHVFIGLSAIFVFWISITYCYSTKYWLIGSDPTYAYLLNGLNIATLHGVGHTDHPGTVLQILCAILLRIFYFFAPDASATTITQSVLTNPEWYLKNIYASIFVLQSVILAAVAAWVWASFNNAALLSVILGGLFVSPQVISIQASALRPEILIPLLLFLLTLVTLKRWREDTLNPPVPSRSLAWSAGTLTGLALFTKVTCFPIFCVPFFFWKDKKSKWHYLAGFACIAFMCLLPVWKSLGGTIKWFLDLALREGRYGSGLATVLSPERFCANMLTIFSSNISVMSVLALTFVGLFILRKYRYFFVWRISVFYIFSIVFIIILVAKHYAQHYLLAIYMPVFFIPFLYASENKNSIKIVSCVIYIIFIFLSISELYNTIMERNKETSGTFYSYSENMFDNKIIVDSYNSCTLTYALSFGNDYAKKRYGKLLQSIYPYSFSYNIWDKKFYHFGESVSFESIISSGQSIMIRGTHLEDNYADHLILGKKISSFPEGDVIYELLGKK